MSSLRRTLQPLAAVFACLYFLAIATSVAESTPCDRLTKPTIPGATVISIQSQHLPNASVLASPPLLNTNVTGLDICSVDIVLSHRDANDTVKVKVWLPSTGWNGRFLGTGGSGYAAGFFELSLAPVVTLGYAAASTDAGLSGEPYTPAAWALDGQGNVDKALLLNFASRSVHDMAVAGKAIATQYYGREPHHSYWNGCSTGGRQGLMAAQTHPEDFDGIVAGAPAIDWARYVIAEQWPQVVMREEGIYPSRCLLQAFTNASIAACDSLDGLADGIISSPQACKFDAHAMVGSTFHCEDGQEEETVTPRIVSVLAKIVAGPKGPTFTHKYALYAGAALDSLANTTTDSEGKTVGYPFFVNDAWIKYFVRKDPNFDTTTVGYASFAQLFTASQHEYGALIGGYNPDLSRFRAAGGKAIVWHGEADQLIFPAGTVEYHRMVERVVGHGNASAVAGFYRTFLAPGVDHCGAGALTGTSPGAVPVDPLAAVVAWVEKGVAPDVLDASIQSVGDDGVVVTRTRNLCPFPSRSRYRGGDAAAEGSYVCA
ncbi:putative tannase [Cladophialophora carrionii]|uniref:Carboxylic ester hydrolase n=1 Tax=Cladophialophora carrionii TaxID=86049 RepID=A0A1C1CL26_9EURO|nr:putative tannase [Cladophialophora carrionii]